MTLRDCVRILVSASIFSLPVIARSASSQFHFSSSNINYVNDQPSTSILQQPESTYPIDYPYRELPWGEVNVIHTTDTHGWLLGHQRQEPNYSGDWGDLYSFVVRMKEEARRRGVDLLVVDSGDRVDGNGFVDGEPASQVKGYSAMKFFQQMPYDIITTGNHELYNYTVSLSTYRNLVAHYSERYVTSNVNITLPLEEDGIERTVPLGSRFRKFITEQGRSVTAFGPIFDFKAHEAGTDIQSPTEMILEPWFIEAIQEECDFFLLVGHMSIRGGDSEWTAIVSAIRVVHPLIPILVFGGHHHIRDCVQEDDRSMSLASGRYMETIGFLSVSGLSKDGATPLQFSRRYLDQNRNTYAYHAGLDFDTEIGQEMSRSMTKVAANFNLTQEFGIAPHSYYLNRSPPTSEASMFNLLTSHILPLLVQRPDRPYPSVTLLNTGSIRFDVFKGSFTRNDQWIILPFSNNFEYVRGVKRDVASQLLAYLNIVGEHGLFDQSTISHTCASVERIYRQNQVESFATFVESASSSNATWGYVTNDACQGLGDDVLHKPLPAFPQPVFVSTAFPPSEEGIKQEDARVDVVFFDFIERDIIAALNALQSETIYSARDVGLYITSLNANTLVQEYAKRKW